MGWSELLHSLEQSREKLDRQTTGLTGTIDQNLPHIYCGKGCSNCCLLAVNCSFPEAVAITKTLNADQQQELYDKIPFLQQISGQAESLTQFLRLFRQQLNGCPLLNPDDGSCSIYPLRPFSCRALLSTRNSSWCAIDFADLHPQEKEAFLSSLDPQVVAYPTHYLAQSQQLGLELEAQSIIAMRETFGASISGNLLYQLWLELEYQLSDVVQQGSVATRTFLEERSLNLPFLLQLQTD